MASAGTPPPASSSASPGLTGVLPGCAPTASVPRQVARAGPSDDGGEWDAWPREPEERDGWLRELDDSAMMEAYFDAKCGGEDGDWADIAFEASLYEF